MQVQTAVTVTPPSEISSLVFFGECTRRMVGSYFSGLSILCIHSVAQNILASQWTGSLGSPLLGSILIMSVMGGTIPAASNFARELAQTQWDGVLKGIESKCGGLWNKIPWKEKKPKVAAKPESNRSTASSSRVKEQPKYFYIPTGNPYNNGQHVFRNGYHQSYRKPRNQPFHSYSYPEYTRTGNVPSSSGRGSPVITVVDEDERDEDERDEVVIQDEGGDDGVDQSTVFSTPALPLQK